eukprot:GILJ01010615.1.p1 GENE.GILJ01010615.1~~GILJ01010615.1.p1  ORF type:complete len:481 (+),score=78.17 GILJ01010615.1:955-2397(+)
MDYDDDDDFGSAVNALGKRKNSTEEPTTEKVRGDGTRVQADTVEPMEVQVMSTTFNPELLRLYYSRLFPYKYMFRWLSYGNDPKSEDPTVSHDYFLRREFSFTMENDVYIRYLCFVDHEAMKAEMQRMQPRKIDIGAVFTVPPKNHNTVKNSADFKAFQPLEKEFVFDIDMTDYDSVRTCCSGAAVCPKCWTFLTVAIKVLDSGLRADFGFQHLLWVYSGRRGVHCWVCDQRARSLTNDGRGAVAEYFHVFTGSENKEKKVNLGEPMHPSLRRAYDEILKPMFEELIAEDNQNLLADAAHREKILNMIPDEDLRADIRQRWGNGGMSASNKWELLCNMVDKAALKAATGHKKRSSPLSRCVPEIVFSYIYPRLDINVSKGLNHLLKSPFSVHPATNRVCIPIDPNRAETFDPTAVGTLSQFAAEIDAWDAAHPDDNRKTKDYKKTSFAASIEFFKRRFLQPLEGSIRSAKIKQASSTLDF